MVARSAALAVCLALLAGCTAPQDTGGQGTTGTGTVGDGDGGATTSGSLTVTSTDGLRPEGSASVYLKDAPADDFREVHVVITEVAIHRSAGEANGTTSATGTTTGSANGTADNGTVSLSASASATGTGSPGAEAGWIVVLSDAEGVDVDLLNTTGARAAYLGEAELDAGRYQQVRIEVAEAYGVTHDGERVNITVSSGTLRVTGGFEVVAGNETRVTVDIDLERSLREQGSGAWRLTPVIGRTTAAEVEDASSGEEAAEPGEVQDVPEVDEDAES